jgi:hypothetical protein
MLREERNKSIKVNNIYSSKYCEFQTLHMGINSETSVKEIYIRPNKYVSLWLGNASLKVRYMLKTYFSPRPDAAIVRCEWL